jgi:hypothetical protein
MTVSDEKPDMKLFWACFIALVATSFVFGIRSDLIGELAARFNLSESDKGEILGVGLWPFALSIIALGLGTFAWARRDLSDIEDDSDGVDGLAANPKGLLSARAGLLAAIVAMLWPPLLATVYVRGALGEADVCRVPGCGHMVSDASNGELH